MVFPMDTSGRPRKRPFPRARLSSEQTSPASKLERAQRYPLPGGSPIRPIFPTYCGTRSFIEPALVSTLLQLACSLVQFTCDPCSIIRGRNQFRSEPLRSRPAMIPRRRSPATTHTSTTAAKAAIEGRRPTTLGHGPPWFRESYRKNPATAPSAGRPDCAGHSGCYESAAFNHWLALVHSA